MAARPSASARSEGFRFRTADAALAVLIVAVVALMVIPLPTWLLDVLLASNLAASVAILLVALYVGSALEISTFPTLLLVTTLVRIALNVSSTRLILLRGDAGEVIRAFGEFVVSGNLVVGAVVFAILTIVQFVVVAKGSERVAEVGARFSLDALPGKQLAIDAELRAGSIDPDEARRRRRTLERESHFYGAMDGAVRFVKGDVIASVVIAVVNLVGGVAIGVLQRGMTAPAALQKYGLLTIGDGLVTQIPALLLATAAGILVTRVASETDSPLGSQLSRELLGAPRALGVAGVLVLGFALVPGLPAVPFVVIGVALLGLFRSLHAKARPRDGAPGEDDDEDDDGTTGFVPRVVPWSLDFGPRVARELKRRDGSLSAIAERTRRRVFQERGVPLPPCRARMDDSLPDRHVVLSIHEMPATVVEVEENADTGASVRQIEDAVGRLLLDRAADFLGIGETKTLVDALEQHAPATVRQVVPKMVDVGVLAEVLRRLVEEEVSVRDLKAILEAIARAPGEGRDPLALTEHVRSELRRALTYDLTRGANELEVVVLDSNIEESIRGAIARTSSGSFLSLSPAAARDVVASVERVLAGGPETAVILTRPDIRRFVRKLIETDLPRVRVLSFGELLPEVLLKTRGRATLSGI